MKLSDGVENLGTLSGNSFEMICDVEVGSAQKAGLKLRVGEGEETLLYLDTATQKVVLDRTKTGAPFAQEFGNIRQKNYQKDKIRFQIFMDTSSIEVFVNEGEIVFTSRLFPKKESQGIQFFTEEGSAKIDAVQWMYE